MALSNQIAVYADCEMLFRHAADDKLGARAMFESEAAAKHFRLRMHQYRVLERKESRRLYDRMDPRWDKCEYDRFVCRVREDTEGNFWLYVEPFDRTVPIIEGLSAAEVTNES